MDDHKKIRSILFILEYFEPYVGGIEKLFGALAREFFQEDYRVTVVCRKHDQSLPSKSSKGIEIIRLAAKSRMDYSLQLIRLPTRQMNNPDLIITSSFLPALPAFLISKKIERPCVLVYHEVWQQIWFRLYDIPIWKRPLYYFYEKIVLETPFQKVVAVSEYTYEELKKYIDHKRLHLIRNGINYEKYRDLRHSEMELKHPFTFMYFGRLGVSKGLSLLLDGLMELKRKKVGPFRIVLAIPKLEQQELAELSRTIKQKDLTEEVTLKVGLDNLELMQNIAASDAVVIPSKTEGFCFAAVETQALGVPIVSSGQGALKEVVGGKHISMDAYNKESLVIALEKAVKNQWTITEKKEFHLSKTVEQYRLLVDIMISNQNTQ